MISDALESEDDGLQLGSPSTGSAPSQWELPELKNNALAQRLWPQGTLYVFPTVPLIPPLLKRIKAECRTVILIAQDRHSSDFQRWFASQIMDPCPLLMVDQGTSSARAGLNAARLLAPIV